MKGRNKFVFNHETMKEALHHWMSDTLLKNGDDFEVESVTVQGADEFAIVVNELPDEDPEP